jgi:enterochelin esterase-like enzyme
MEKTFQVKNKLLLLLIGILLPACAAAPINANQPQSAAATQKPTETAPTVPPPSKTPTVEATQLPTVTPTSTWTPTPEPTFTPEPCLQESGTVTNLSLPTDLSVWPWDFRIYTPPCYEVFTEQYYPLLILIHGSTYTDSQWDDLGADETADNLIQSGQAPPFIILMPRDRIWIDPLEDPFGEALITRILPWVEDNYRSIPGKEFRAIGGLSRGASWAVHLGLKYPALFSAIGAHSLPVFVTDPPRLTRWLNEIPEDELPRIYLDIGEKDYLLDKTLWFENLLTEKNIPHEFYLNPGRHEEAYWADHVEEYLLWYTSVWLP